MRMIVHKFGGTSVGNVDRFGAVAEIVLSHHGTSADAINAETPAGVVVVSAMSGVTDQLMSGARAAAEGRDTVYRQIKADLLSRHLDVVETLLEDSRERLKVGGLIEDRLHDLERLYRSIAVLGELTARGRDVVASFGEQLSVNILAAVLRERGVRARAFSSTELIVTNDQFGAATPLIESTRQQLQQRIRPLIERGVLPVITGYIGATEEGVPTTLGRGGSDFSAALIGAGLDADEVWIWSDVDGILTADPNLVPQARTLTELSYTEAADLAYVGAEVLHPKTIRPVIRSTIPLRIVNSFNPAHPGTLIVEAPGADREVLPAIISTTGLSMIAVGSEDDSWTLQMAARVLQRLSEGGLAVLMFSQSLSEHNLNLVVGEKDQDHCLRILRREFKNGHRDDVFRLGVKEKVATISVVGMPGWNGRRNGIVSHAFAALGEHNTRVIAVAQAATEHSVSFCIPEGQLADAVRFLHRELGLEDGERKT
jgi:bifunctional aspartokinase / homoserine dehydrogenase 1